MENKKNINETIADALKEVKSVLDADTIIGKQIVTNSGLTIIPISKMTMGIVTGGLNIPSKEEKKNVGGAGGTGISIEPVAFLTVTPDGQMEVVPMVTEAPDTLGTIANTVGAIPDVIRKIKAIWQGLTDDLARERAKEKADTDKEESQS